MEQRLIDSNELKTALVNYACYAEYYPVSRMLELIDQCPAVEPQKVCVANVTFDDAKLREIVDEAVHRFLPQGEWIDRTALLEELEKEVKMADDWKTAHELFNVVKYFPHYGADMRGDKE